jgi:hypothetical protein
VVPHEGRLAAPARTDDGDRLAGNGREADLATGEVANGDGEALGELDLQERIRTRPRQGRRYYLVSFSEG